MCTCYLLDRDRPSSNSLIESFSLTQSIIVNNVVYQTPFAQSYVEFCNASKRKLSKCLQDDMLMVLTYDPAMFRFLIPAIFGEIATCGHFTATGNIDLVRLVVSGVDPVSLQELICLCLTGSAKVINKEDVLPLIGEYTY